MNKIVIVFLFIALSPKVLAQTILVSALTHAPKIDGDDFDWSQVPTYEIKLTPTRPMLVSEDLLITLKAGRFQQQVFFYVQWPDARANVIHKPYVWNEERQRYIKGTDREDRLAFQFEMTGEYSTDWTSAEDFEADMWHWKASRSNPLGLAHDKKTVLSENKLLRAARITAPDGAKRYVLRLDDEGTPLYRSIRYGPKEKKQMPKYLLLANPQGSITDVKARGVWLDGSWRLELSRRLDTGHSDDVRFVLDQAVRGGIAVFDASENEDHFISKTLLFQF